MRKTSKRNNFYNALVNSIKNGLNVRQLVLKYAQEGYSKQAINYALQRLIAQGVIQKESRGVYIICKKNNPTVVKESTRLTTSTQEEEFKQDSVRGHGLQWTVRIPSGLKNWDKRVEFLTAEGIVWKPLPIIGGGQGIVVQGRKVWLTNKSIVFWDKKSYFAPTADGAERLAIFGMRDFCRVLERVLRIRLEQLTVRPTRQHYALIKNALAEQYDREGRKLYVADKNGQWLIIDNSFNLHELETVHPVTAKENNTMVQTFFNQVKKYKDFTPEFVMKALMQGAENLDAYAVHLTAHVASVKQLGENADVQSQETRKLREAVEELRDIIKGLRK